MTLIMILVLATRFRKHIALFLYSIFYGQLIMAAENYYGAVSDVRTQRGSFGRDYAGHTEHAGLRKPSWQTLFTGNGNATDSSVTPVKPSAFYGGKIPSVSAASIGRNTRNNPDSRNAAAATAFIGGPTQPETGSFESVNTNNMVDLFSGDFSYNIPLLDVGGYPVNISYHSGVTMDDDASWVGLGWNINPGSITRNMRGLPDDFDGEADTVKKIASIKPNQTFGVNVGDNIELVGLPLPVSLAVSAGIYHSTYNGWGLESALNASINAGAKAHGPLSGGLSLTNSSQNGISINPSLSARFTVHNATDNGGAAFGLQLSAPYNSRTGLKTIQLGLNVNPIVKNQVAQGILNVLPLGGQLSFSWPTYTPGIAMPLTNTSFTFTGKVGGAVTAFHPNLFISGYAEQEYIASADTLQSLPAYGYLNFQDLGGNWASLLDFNREKEMPYRENPPIPHIAVPGYTYDMFTISGEGTGGMFRAYRGDIGFIADHLSKTKTISGAASIDFGGGNIIHGGVDLNANYSVTQAGPWLSENELQNSIAFQNSNGLYQAAYFRNPGEKSVNTKSFYNAIGGDDVVTAGLYQNGSSSSSILATNTLTRYNNKQVVGTVNLTPASAVKNVRDKRTEEISYLTASEASVVGLDKYIYHYAVNQFGIHYCGNDAPGDPVGNGEGLFGSYYANQSLSGTPVHTRTEQLRDVYTNVPVFPQDLTFPHNHFSVRWVGRIKAPATGRYTIGTYSDDGVRLWLDDTLLVNNWTNHGLTWDSSHVNLVAGQLYDIRLEYYQFTGPAEIALGWTPPGTTPLFDPVDHNRFHEWIPTEDEYAPPATDTVQINPVETREDRVNTFRKSNHISEIDVLNPDGRRYVYGIPVYNIMQQEVSFAVNKGNGNTQTGLVTYQDGVDNTTANSNGKDGYYSREKVPAYAHSFLLTGILTPDYVDVTGDGISDDDIGDAVKFTYSKTSGIANPFGWRAPYVTGNADYNEGLRTYDRDDKGHYLFGQKELWYMHTIETKTMVATFTLQPRADLLEADEHGTKTNNGKGMCLKQIDLYAKADLLQNGTAATPIETVHFEYSYELCRGVNLPVNDSGKLTLKKIWFTYNNNDKGPINPFVFNYHSNNPGYQTSMTDKWDIYKDPATNPGATPSNLISNAEYPYAIQDSTLAAYNASAWTLDSIQLPSGGRIKVNYESDDYAYVQNRRATQMFKVAGLGTDTSGNFGNRLYGSTDPLFIYVKVPYAAAGFQDLFARYLDGLQKLYFRMYIQMPTDDFGGGSEYVPAYADPDFAGGRWYGMVNDSLIWIRIKGVNKTGDGDGSLNPIAQTAINFLRLNLPDKAYPGSEVSDNLGFVDGVKIILSMAGNVVDMLNGFSNTARLYGWAARIDTGRSFVRLDCPILKKYGGGLRVKSILSYDNWNAMTGKKEAVYGRTYDYTTTQTVNGVTNIISSGVAQWEPSIGGEENPFHLPIEYVDRASLLAPAATLYTEEPLGEAFYPAASIGYSRVRIRSIHSANTRSANGFEETTFYTSYDFPTLWDWSMLDNNTKKRYKPILSSLLRINAKNYLDLTQGFKVELNDMNGKTRTEASYAQTDSLNPISYTENFYKLDNQSVQTKHLNNCVMTIDPSGNIDTAASIGKDIEVMTDMREEASTSIGGDIDVNLDLFAAGILPIAIPSLIPLFQEETTRFRSVAMTKIIHRNGILDSVVHMENGSKVYSKNLLYDGETGEPLLVRTLNEFDDSVYLFDYPANWMYKGMGYAYQNIDAQLNHLSVSNGKITSGLLQPDTTYLAGGDELLVYSKQAIDTINCISDSATFPNTYKLWVVDTNAINGGPKQLFLMDQNGTPFSGTGISLKVIRSGYRNLDNMAGSVHSLGNPLVRDITGNYHLVYDSTTRVLSAAASDFNQYWKVGDKRRTQGTTTCVTTPQDSALAAAEGCSCLAPFFNYLIAKRLLFIPLARHITVGEIVQLAEQAGFLNSSTSCPILSNNQSGYFYSLSADSVSSLYEAMIGSDVFDIRSVSGLPVNLYRLVSTSCDSLGRAVYKDPTQVITTPAPVVSNFYPSFTVNLLSRLGSSCPSITDTLLTVDSVSDHLLVENSLDIAGYNRNAVSILRFDQLAQQIPAGSNILSAKMILQADQRGHLPGMYNNANSTNLIDSLGISLAGPQGWFPYYPLDSMLYQAYYSSWYKGVKNRTPFQNDTVDVFDWLSTYLTQGNESGTFILTQGSGPLNRQGTTSKAPIQNAVPPYLLGGFGNYYATFYSTRYADQTRWPAIQVTYVPPPAFADTSGALLEFNATIACSTVMGRTCYSSVTDTTVNPYAFGILGNWRPLDEYSYYGRRSETNPRQATNIRRDGAIAGFVPYWSLQGGTWSPSADTARWVSSEQSTLFNRKGFVIENKDHMGIYTSGIYGFGQTLPVAVTKNSRYQESAFEGFEDYSMVSNTCDTFCAETRPFDFSLYQANISDSAAHTGLYSLRLGQGAAISIPVPIQSAPDQSNPRLLDSAFIDTCHNSRFYGIRASGNILVPPFEPYAGKRMLVSAWVKEVKTCTCQSYSRNHLFLNFTLAGGDTTDLVLSASGNIIEGWQRFESIVDIPSNATGMTVTLQASDSSTTYFDDIRFHPFNAEMRSYIYNPINLRLMAELDQNNYAIFYECNDDGTLVREKKETERGIQTVNETRKSLLLNQ